MNPAPPPGPGVFAPFPAPPVEGRGRRVGWGIGVAAGVALLVCGGGAAALVGVVIAGTASLQEHAEAAVGDYLTAVKDKRFDEAYGMLCDDAQEAESPAAFRNRIAGEQAITDWKFGDLDFTSLSLPVDLTYAGGAVDTVEALLDQDTGTGDLEVCSVGE